MLAIRLLRKRFSDDIINKLLQIDYEKISHEENNDFRQYWNEELKEDNVDDIIRSFCESK